MSGNLFIIVAPSGAGKSTLVKALLEQDSNLKLSISYTTRCPRSIEEKNRDYVFIDTNEFLRLRDERKMLEWALVHGHLYGTPKDWVFEQLERGEDIILEIDWQGAIQVKNIFQMAIEVFILPPSLSVLEDRLKKRGQDSQESITQRLNHADIELSYAINAEYVVVNQEFQKAIDDLRSIIAASRLKFLAQRQKNKALFQHLGILLV